MEEIKAMKKELNEVRHLNTVAASADEKPSINKKIKNRQKKKRLFTIGTSTPFINRMGTRKSPIQDIPEAHETKTTPVLSPTATEPKRRFSPRLQENKEKAKRSSPVTRGQDFSSQLSQESSLISLKQRRFSNTSDVSSNIVAQLLQSNNRMVALNTLQTMQTQNALIVNQIFSTNQL
jgi:hypothetical protein